MRATVRSPRLMTVLAAVVVFINILPAAAQSAPGGQKPGAPTEQTLPGGASEVQETHGDWRVTCTQQNGQKICALSQQQTDKENRQLVIGVELKALSSERAEGTMVLPFGLAVAKPVSLQVDESAAMPQLQFSTCVPVGCLVPLVLDAATTANLRKGAVLSVKAMAADGSQDVAFRISLRGFASALDRTAMLAK